MRQQGDNDEEMSPTIEALAADGTVLENYYVFKFCAPSYALILTRHIPEDHFTQCHTCTKDIDPPDYADGSRVCNTHPNGCNVKCPAVGGVNLWCENGPAIGENGMYTVYLFGQ